MGTCYSLYEINQLKNQDTNVPFFDFNGQTHYVKVINVYDGDTCHAIMKINGNYYKIKIRAFGYDSPEMKPSKDDPNRIIIKEKALEARNYLISRITDTENTTNLSNDDINNSVKNNKKIIKLKCYGWDKYGRLLADFFVNDININQEMITKNYAYSYHGGTKQNCN